jgi:hypothetical protein
VRQPDSSRRARLQGQVCSNQCCDRAVESSPGNRRFRIIPFEVDESCYSSSIHCMCRPTTRPGHSAGEVCASTALNVAAQQRGRSVPDAPPSSRSRVLCSRIAGPQRATHAEHFGLIALLRRVFAYLSARLRFMPHSQWRKARLCTPLSAARNAAHDVRSFRK